MHFGLYLKGGGAKGAFQAGLLCAFWQRGVTYSVIGGTSIGAINGWYVVHNAFKELEDLYTGKDDLLKDYTLSGKVMDNSALIDGLKSMEKKKNQDIQSFYVNYVTVSDGVLSEEVEDILGLDEAKALERIRWSALLPLNLKEKMSFTEYIDYAQKHDLTEKFKNDLANHVYDGINLDGGLLNNHMIPKVFDHQHERVIALGYNGSRDDYLDTLTTLDPTHKEKIVYISADDDFKAEDTYNFTPDFLKRRFEKGYRKGIEYPFIRLVSR